MKKHNPGNTVHIESRALASRAQLIDLLSVFGSVGHMMLNSQQDREDGTSKELDGGVKCAVETTMINVCSRLDALLADDSRWSLDERDALGETLTKSYEASTEMFSHQAAIAKEANTPHAKMSPYIVRLAPGMWLAIKGDLDNIDASICGIGSSPAAALDCFDRAFNGTLTPEQVKDIKLTLNPFTHETTLDGTGAGDTKTITDGGTDPASHSAENEQDLQVSGESGNQPPHTGLALPGDGGFDSADVPPGPAYGPNDDPGLGH
jgi:hypothetical protein